VGSLNSFLLFDSISQAFFKVKLYALTSEGGEWSASHSGYTHWIEDCPKHGTEEKNINTPPKNQNWLSRCSASDNHHSSKIFLYKHKLYILCNSCSACCQSDFNKQHFLTLTERGGLEQSNMNLTHLTRDCHVAWYCSSSYCIAITCLGLMNNWFCCWAMWVMKYLCHKQNTRPMNLTEVTKGHHSIHRIDICVPLTQPTHLNRIKWTIHACTTSSSTLPFLVIHSALPCRVQCL